MRKHKILIAVAAHYSRSKAFESFLKEEGYSVKVVTRNMKKKYNFSNFIHEIFSWKPDIVHVINDPEIMALVVSVAARLSGAKVIYDRRANCSLERKELRKDFFYFIERVSELFGGIFYDKKITPLYKIYKTGKYSLIPQTIILNKPLKSKSKKKIIFTASRLIDWYDIETVLEAFQKMNQKNTELWIFGDGEKKQELMNLASDKRIKFFGEVQHEKYLQYLYKANVCIVSVNKTKTSNYMSPYSSRKLGEFTFFEKPTICSNIGDMKLAKRSGVLFYEPKNSEDLKNKMIKQLNNPVKTKFFEELDRKKVKKKYIKIIKSLT